MTFIGICLGSCLAALTNRSNRLRLVIVVFLPIRFPMVGRESEIKYTLSGGGSSWFKTFTKLIRLVPFEGTIFFSDSNAESRLFELSTGIQLKEESELSESALSLNPII